MLSPSFITKEIVLTRIKQVVLSALSENIVHDVEVFDNHFLDQVIVRTTQTMLAKKAGDRIIRYPENWKEAFKERWLPKQLKHRFPVKYKEFDALVVYPNLLKEFPVPGELRGNNYYLTFAEIGTILPFED